MTRVRFCTVAVVLLLALLHLSAAEPDGEKAARRTEYYDVIAPGVVRLSTSTDKSRYKAGDPIIATNHLTNIGDSVFLVDESSLAEGFYIQQLDSTSLCGSIGDHSPGYQPRVAELPSGATIIKSWDMSKEFCFKGHGQYEVGGSYCHYDGRLRVHGKDDALWCVRSRPVKIVVR